LTVPAIADNNLRPDTDSGASAVVYTAAPETSSGVVDNLTFLPEISTMARRCELTGKGVLAGNAVSHANNKTRRRFLPNLCNVHLMSDVLGQTVALKISANALKSVEHRGGLDAFLVKASAEELSLKARKLKRDIEKKLKAAA